MYRLLTAGYQEYDNRGTQSAGYQYQYSYYYSGSRSTMQYTDQFTPANSTATWYTCNAANQLDKLYASNTSTFATDPILQYYYDLAGNLTDILTLPAQIYTSHYFYDQAQRLTADRDELHQQLFSYHYDGLGRRYQQAVTPLGVTDATARPTRYTLDINMRLPQVLGESSATQQTWYLPGIGQEQTPIDTGGNPQGSVWSYFHMDQLGSVRQLSDPSGTVNYHASYDPYGVPLNSFGTLSTTLGYTGEQTDPSGLLYLRARYMDPGTGMFLSHDLFEGVVSRAMSRNGYGYVEGNPANYTDPSGKCVDPISFIFCAAAIVGGLAFINDWREQVYDNQMHGMPFSQAIGAGHLNWNSLGNSFTQGAGAESASMLVAHSFR